jgi:L-threonylcarbamoyladenylate synthase
MTNILSEGDPQSLITAIQTIQSGGIVAFPTDTVYGIGVSAFNEKAIRQLFEVKSREGNKAIAVLLADIQQLTQVCIDIPTYAAQLANAFWPGALTLVLPRQSSLPGILSPLPTIGVRIPDHPFARSLIRACGPLAVTSANISGQASAVNPSMIKDQLGGLIPLIIDGGESRGGLASTVVDCTGPSFKILRSGEISELQLNKAMAG